MENGRSTALSWARKVGPVDRQEKQIGKARERNQEGD